MAIDWNVGLYTPAYAQVKEQFLLLHLKVFDFLKRLYEYD